MNKVHLITYIWRICKDADSKVNWTESLIQLFFCLALSLMSKKGSLGVSKRQTEALK